MTLRTAKHTSTWLFWLDDQPQFTKDNPMSSLVTTRAGADKWGRGLLMWHREAKQVQYCREGGRKVFTMKRMRTITVKNVDMLDLDSQRLKLANFLTEHGVPESTNDELWGVVNLLDAMSDQVYFEEVGGESK